MLVKPGLRDGVLRQLGPLQYDRLHHRQYNQRLFFIWYRLSGGRRLRLLGPTRCLSFMRELPNQFGLLEWVL
jgi:hypothetical protein